MKSECSVGIPLFLFVVALATSCNGQIPTAKNGSGGLQELTAADTPLRQGEKIAFFGDSITMQGGFIQLIDKAIKESANTKDLKIKLFKHGLNGGRVQTVIEGKSPWGNLGGSMQSLLEKETPTVIVIYLGINDVWHGEKGTSQADFKSGLKKMVAMCKEQKATILLCTPTVIGEETKENKLNETLREYSEIIRQLAAAEKLLVCDLHTTFVEKLKKVNPENKHKGNLTYDGVHMNPQGNALLADQIAGEIYAACKTRNTKK